MEKLTDRRKIQRWRFTSPVVGKVILNLDEVPVDVRNVSEKGLHIEGPLDSLVGSYVPIKLRIADGPTIELMSRIVWKKGRREGAENQEIGLQLLKMQGFESYQSAFNSLPKEAMTERRNSSESDGKEGNKSAAAENRGQAAMKTRLALNNWDLDDWASIHSYGRIIESGSESSVTIRKSQKIMLGANNYMGLSTHPRVKEAAIKAIEKYGAGAGGVRVLSGTMDLHKQLEERLAKFKGTESCILLPSGYSANVAVLTTLLNKDDIVFNDALNHASIIDGCRATAAAVHFYSHSDVASLRKKVARYDRSRPMMIITDGVFSMDGDAAPLKEILDVASEVKAMTMVDDAHATGVIGERGHGTAEYCGVVGKVDITIVTLSKALGAVGGAVCGSSVLIKRIFHKSRSFIFTSALPPSVCASALTALDVIDSEPHLLQNLRRNRKFLYEGLTALGYEVRDTPSAILPVIIGDEARTYRIAARLEELDVFVNAVSPPAVPNGSSRLRVSVMATHTLDQLGKSLEAFKKAGKELKII